MLGTGTVKKIAKRVLIELTGGYNRTFSIFHRKELNNIKYYFGSSWICLSYEMELWIEKYLNDHPEYIHFYKNTICPDESFFQTLVMNSPYRNKIEDYLHYVNWGFSGNSPKIIKTEDFQRLKESKKLMARKFDSAIDKKVMFDLEELISDKNDK